jgi:hypothetical protein
MITVQGFNDNVFGFFACPTGNMPGGYHAPEYTTFGLAPFLLPPPDGVLYPIEEFTEPNQYFDIDFMDKVRGQHIPFKPVSHGKMEALLRPILHKPYTDQFRGKDEPRYEIGEDGLPSTSTSYLSVSSLLVNGQGVDTEISISQLQLENDTRKSVTDGSILVTPYRYALNIAESRDVAMYRKFDSGTSSDNILFKKTIIQQHGVISPSQEDASFFWLGLDSDPTGPLEIPYTYCYSITDLVVKLTHIQNTGGQLFLFGEWTYTKTFRDYPNDVISEGSGPFPFSSELVISTAFPPSGLDPLKIQHYFRVYSDYILFDDNDEFNRTQTRTRALLEHEDIGSNMIENISGISGLGDAIKGLINAVKAFKSFNIKTATKALADVWLIMNYVVLASGRDAVKVKKNGLGILIKITNPDEYVSKRRAGETYTTNPFFLDSLRVRYQAGYTLSLDNSWLATVVNALDSLGLLPSPKNLWDLIPLSFVIDWFVNVGDILDACYRAAGDKNVYNILARVESKKAKYVLNQKSVDYLFGANWRVSKSKGSIYVRTVDHDWGRFDLIALAGTGPLGFNQFISGGSLIVQRIK